MKAAATRSGCIEMKVNADSKFAMPKWTWILSVISSLAVLGGIWWASYAGPLQVSSQPSERIKAAGVSVAPISPADKQPLVVQPVKSSGVAPAAVKATPVKSEPRSKPCAKKPSPLQGMFPMGDVAASMPALRHDFRYIAELFPSFGYGGRLWAFTGRFAYSNQLDLVPTGFSLSQRRALRSCQYGGNGRGAVCPERARPPAACDIQGNGVVREIDN